MIANLHLEDQVEAIVHIVGEQVPRSQPQQQMPIIVRAVIDRSDLLRVLHEREQLHVIGLAVLDFVGEYKGLCWSVLADLHVSNEEKAAQVAAVLACVALVLAVAVDRAALVLFLLEVLRQSVGPLQARHKHMVQADNATIGDLVTLLEGNFKFPCHVNGEVLDL